MSNDIQTLKDEIKRLKAKLKQKSEKLKDSNNEIKARKRRAEERYLDIHIKSFYVDILEELTGHLQKHKYEITFSFEGAKYKEAVFSFGARWLLPELAIVLSEKTRQIVYPNELKILEAKKLW